MLVGGVTGALLGFSFGFVGGLLGLGAGITAGGTVAEEDGSIAVEFQASLGQGDVGSLLLHGIRPRRGGHHRGGSRRSLS